MSTIILYDHQKMRSKHYVDRYFKFISTRNNNTEDYTEKHHILPKAKDFYPEFKCLKTHTWNVVELSAREHFIAHWMLSRAFPGTSQSRAFYYMCNKIGHRKSKAYEQGRVAHIQNMKNKMYTNERNAKISKSLKGVPKSQEHRNKLMGHSVSDETREKIRMSLTGRKMHSEAARLIMSQTRKGRKMGEMSQTQKHTISATKKSQGRKWYNDGHSNKMFARNEAPDGWSVGRLPWVQQK